MIVFLGDTFHALNPSETLRRMFWRALKPAKDQKLDIRILIGNHDTTGQSYNFSSDKEILSPNIRVIQTYESETFGAQTVHYFPFAPKDQILEWFKKVKDSDLTLAHFEIENAELAPDNMTIRQGLRLSDIKGMCFSGHIHKHQILRQNPIVAYVGSNVKCDFGEVNNRKVFAVVGQKVEFIDIPQRPMYQAEINEKAPAMLTSELTPKEYYEKGVLLKFKFVGSKEWCKSIDKTKFKKRFKNAIRVITEDQCLDTDRKDSVITSNMEERVHHYVKEKQRGKPYLDVGVEIAKVVDEVEL
jgi:DNA repair exonuclease SbcCD nuclease subunit